MKTSYVFLADGFEEIEAMAPVDVMRRAGMNVVTVSITDSQTVTGAHGVKVNADKLFKELTFDDAEWLVCPGGMPGAKNLAEYQPLTDLLVAHFDAGKKVAAICASPALVLAPLGLLDSKAATCYPGMESNCSKSTMLDQYVVTDGNVVTGQGPAAAIEFGLTLVSITLGNAAADDISNGMLYNRH